MKILLALLPLLLISCGTISAKDYTDLAIQKASLESRLQSAQDARDLDAAQADAVKRSMELWISQQGFIDGRRKHRPTQ